MSSLTEFRNWWQKVGIDMTPYEVYIAAFCFGAGKSVEEVRSGQKLVSEVYLSRSLEIIESSWNEQERVEPLFDACFSVFVKGKKIREDAYREMPEEFVTGSDKIIKKLALLNQKSGVP